jgi:DNA-binding CsgD family transcriptional regulator
VLALIEQGQLDAAEALVPETLGPSGLLQTAIGSRGRLRLARGQLAAAIEDLAEARDRAAAGYPLRVEPPWQPLLVEALVLADRGAEAAAEVDALVPAVEHWGTPRAHGHLARLRALLAPREQAIALLEHAVEQFATAPLERARALVELGARQGAAGERRAARATLREAFDAAHACGATALEQRARDELRLVGGRPRTPAGGELTPAERRVADLAAGGATNREIARRLFLSPKTIEMHLRSVYRKLDITGREGLRPGSGTG